MPPMVIPLVEAPLAAIHIIIKATGSDRENMQANEIASSRLAGLCVGVLLNLPHRSWLDELVGENLIESTRRRI